MSDYTKLTNYAVKDGYTSGTPAKVVKGTELDDEFNAISVAIATKVDSTDVIPVSSGGTNATTANDARLNLSAAKSGANSDITSLTGLTTPLAVSQGGVGVATLATNAVVLGNGTGAVQTVAPSTSGNVLTSNGTTWISSPAQTIATGAGAVSSSGTFTATTGSSGKCLITLHGKSSSSFGNFGDRTVGIQINGSVVAATVIRTIEWDGRLTNIGASVTYMYTGAANSNVTVTYYSAGAGNAGDGFYSFIGT